MQDHPMFSPKAAASSDDRARLMSSQLSSSSVMRAPSRLMSPGGKEISRLQHTNTSDASSMAEGQSNGDGGLQDSSW